MIMEHGSNINHMKNTLLIIILLLLPALLCAQTANAVEQLLASNAVTFEEAAWLALEAAGVNWTENTGVNDISNSSRAFSYAQSSKWLSAKAAPSQKIKLNQTALLVMQAFKIKGGPMYSIFKSPHYAYREIVYQKIINGRIDPAMTVSGDMLLYIINRVFYLIETNNLKAPAIPEPKIERRSRETLALAEEINAQIEAMEIEDASVRVTDEGITISLSNIQFVANSAALPENEKNKIHDIARILESIPSRRNLLISGHTALAGTRGEQLRTSRERAQSVADYLIELGVRNANELIVQGFGSDRPLMDNSTREGMALNRRVEITLLEEQL